MHTVAIKRHIIFSRSVTLFTMWEHKNSLMFPDKQSDPVALLNDGLGTSGAQPASGGVRSQGYRNMFF